MELGLGLGSGLGSGLGLGLGSGLGLGLGFRLGLELGLGLGSGLGLDGKERRAEGLRRGCQVAGQQLEQQGAALQEVGDGVRVRVGVRG